MTGILSILPRSVARAMFEFTRRFLVATGEEFLTIRRFPKHSRTPIYRLIDIPATLDNEAIAVVLQGPLVREDDFTLETVRLYRAVCPTFRIIISTWRSESLEYVSQLRNAGAEIVLNDPPNIPGRYNLNYQIISAAAGIARATELGCTYVAKTRTDERAYAIHVLERLPMLQKMFPVRNAVGQSSRLFSVSMTTPKVSPWFLSDLFMFGRTEDMSIYWNPPTDTCILTREELNALHAQAGTIEEATRLAPERYLVTEYWKRVAGKSPEYTVDAWWKALADRFIILDWSQLDLYWPKYSSADERLDIGFGYYRRVNTPFDFLGWLSLYFDRSSPTPQIETLPSTSPHVAAPVRTDGDNSSPAMNAQPAATPLSSP